MPPKRNMGINEGIVITHLGMFFLIASYFAGCGQPSLTLTFTYFPSHVFQLVIMFCNKRFHVSFFPYVFIFCWSLYQPISDTVKSVMVKMAKLY